MDPNELESVKYMYMHHGRSRTVHLTTTMEECIAVCEPANMPAEAALARLMKEYGDGPVIQYSADYIPAEPRPRYECDSNASTGVKWVAAYRITREARRIVPGGVVYVAWYGSDYDHLVCEDLYQAYKSVAGFDIYKKIVI